MKTAFFTVFLALLAACTMQTGPDQSSSPLSMAHLRQKASPKCGSPVSTACWQHRLRKTKFRVRSPFSGMGKSSFIKPMEKQMPAG